MSPDDPLTPAGRGGFGEFNGFSVRHYLVALQRHAAAVALDPAAWMPWNYTATLAARDCAGAEPAPD